MKGLSLSGRVQISENGIILQDAAATVFDNWILVKKPCYWLSRLKESGLKWIKYAITFAVEDAGSSRQSSESDPRGRGRILCSHRKRTTQFLDLMRGQTVVSLRISWRDIWPHSRLDAGKHL